MTRPATHIWRLLSWGRTLAKHGALRGIERYPVTSHVVGGQTVALAGARAKSETRCHASHLFLREGARWNLEMSIRYLDDLVRVGDDWRFAERVLAVDWESERELPNRDRRSE